MESFEFERTFVKEERSSATAETRWRTVAIFFRVYIRDLINSLILKLDAILLKILAHADDMVLLAQFLVWTAEISLLNIIEKGAVAVDMTFNTYKTVRMVSMLSAKTCVSVFPSFKVGEL